MTEAIRNDRNLGERAEGQQSPDPDDSSIIRQRRPSICGESYDPEKDKDTSSLLNSIHSKSKEDRAKLFDVLEHVWLTKDMDLDQRESIIDGLALKTYRAGEKLFEIGDSAEKFYIVKSGKFEAYQADEGARPPPGKEEKNENAKKGIEERNLTLSKTFEANDFFGEIALLYDPPRTCRVIASKDVRAGENKVFEIGRDLFRKLVIQKAYQKRKKFEQIIEKCSLFDHLSEKDKFKVVSALRTKFYRDKDVVLTVNDVGRGMHFVLSGNVQIEIAGRTGTPFKTLVTPGQWMGELSLLLNEQPKNEHTLKAFAVGNTITGYLDANDFEKILGKNSIARNSKKYEELIKLALTKPV